MWEPACLPPNAGEMHYPYEWVPYITEIQVLRWWYSLCTVPLVPLRRHRQGDWHCPSGRGELPVHGSRCSMCFADPMCLVDVAAAPHHMLCHAALCCDMTCLLSSAQILRAGRLLILCVPGEFTTMAGRRLKRAVQATVSWCWGARCRVQGAGCWLTAVAIM